MEIDALRVDEGLAEAGRKELLLPYVDVSKYRRLRVISCADVSMDIILEFSVENKAHPCIEGQQYCESHRCLSRTWRTTRHNVTFPFVRVRIHNSSGQPNEELQLRVYGEPLPGWTDPRQAVLSKEPVEELPLTPRLSGRRGSSPPQMVAHLKAPAKSLFGKKKTDKPDPLPGYIPEGSLLVGDRFGKLHCLPKGTNGEYMMMVDGKPCWALPYPPKY